MDHSSDTRFKSIGCVLLLLAFAITTERSTDHVHLNHISGPQSTIQSAISRNYLRGASTEKFPSPCQSRPCQNGAECQEVPVEYLCQCPGESTRSDVSCDGSNELCHPMSCQESVTCYPSPSSSVELTCRCRFGSSWGSCEGWVQNCSHSLCGEGTRCQVLSVLHKEPGYSCLCKAGYTGTRCETHVNACASNPCKNRAVCRGRADGYACYCVPGFQGKHCELEVNECASQPCQNAATCLNMIGRYFCLCTPGYTGTNCELQIDECQSQPCFNGARCNDQLNSFSCTCTDGFQGEFCEIDIDECRSQPCQNGVPCIDGLNSYRCNCSDSGFMGSNCEIPEPPCMSYPCFNNALCQENHGNYTCNCWPGFTGRHCEVDISECASSPCLSGGACIERSWKTLYGTEPLLPAYFNSQYALGFVCRCTPGLRGTLCEEDINECDLNPCQNGGMCENIHGDYACHCLEQSQNGLLYGGKNCTELLVGCEGHECQNGGTCLHLFNAGQHGYSCICSSGFIGSNCQTSTTFSLETKGYVRLESSLIDSDNSFNITMSFKTALANAILFQRERRELLIKLELENSHLHLTMHGDSVLIQALELSHNVTDFEWHSVEAVLENRTLKVKLLDSSCSKDCEKEAVVEIGLLGLESAFHSIFIAGVGEEGNSTNLVEDPFPYFIGCLRDVHVDSQLMVPENWLNGSAVNVALGCSDRDRCEDNPCQTRGRCINLWQSYQCECYRPYEGENCSEAYISARFGAENLQSYAVFSVSDNPGPNIVISMFVRTRSQAGLLLVFSNSTGNYLKMWLEDGKIKIQANGFEKLKGDHFVSDGNFHLVNVVIDRNKMALLQTSQEQRAIPIQTLHVQSKDMVYLGGLPDQLASSSFGGYFRGCIQDVQINAKRLQFYPIGTPVSSYPLEHLVNVTRGCTSDNSCIKNPCKNGGLCHSLWDDFTCTCPPYTGGRRCQEVEWCELAPCPPTTICQTFTHGFECISNATFHEDSGVISYRSNGKVTRNLTSISFSIRTRKQNAAVLHSEKGLEFVTVSVQDSHLFLELFSLSSSLKLSLKSQKPISDGEWHLVELSMVAPWSHASQWTMVIDNDKETSTSNVSGGNLDFLKKGANILLGGLGPDAVWNLFGCLSTVEIGGVSLPYYGDSEVNLPKPQEEQFIQTSGKKPLSGCSGASVCAPNPCQNGGSCEDLFNLFNCSCSSGWSGPHCDVNTDKCHSNPCVHGNCSARALAYDCTCEAGYAGTHCEDEVDLCGNHKCAHGATCLRGIQRYSCLCPENYTGPYCTEEVEEIPWFIIKARPRPKLPVSICGNAGRNYTCFNGGNCSETAMMCSCLPGFTGERCEVEINECKSNPCMNGGYCRNMIDKFYCHCPMSYAGEMCQIDVSDISFYVSLLLWQNLFQLLSYLILRLDDEPEIDWGGNDE